MEKATTKTITEYLKVFKKKIVDKNTKKSFFVHYGFIQTVVNNDFCDIQDFDENGKPYSVSIKVKILDPLLTKLDSANNYPYYIHLQPGVDKDKKPLYFITKDKTSEGELRLDKYGKSHYIVVIRDSDIVKNAPTTQRTLDDILEDL